jgi:hypothetical protein
MTDPVGAPDEPTDDDRALAQQLRDACDEVGLPHNAEALVIHHRANGGMVGAGDAMAGWIKERSELLAEVERLRATAPASEDDEPSNVGIKAHRIAHLAALTDDWDTYGGKPPTTEALTAARFLCTVPTPAGGLQFEWHANGWDVEIEVSPDGTPEFWAHHKGSGTTLSSDWAAGSPPPTPAPTREVIHSVLSDLADDYYSEDAFAAAEDRLLALIAQPDREPLWRGKTEWVHIADWDPSRDVFYNVEEDLSPAGRVGMTPVYRRAAGSPPPTPADEWEVFTASDGEQAIRLKDPPPPPTPAPTRELVVEAITGSYSTNPPGIIERAADAVMALIAGPDREPLS